MQIDDLLPNFFAALLTNRHALSGRRSHRLVPVTLLVGEPVVDCQSQRGEGGDDIEGEVETEASVVCRTLVRREDERGGDCVVVSGNSAKGRWMYVYEFSWSPLPVCLLQSAVPVPCPTKYSQYPLPLTRADLSHAVHDTEPDRGGGVTARGVPRPGEHEGDAAERSGDDEECGKVPNRVVLCNSEEDGEPHGREQHGDDDEDAPLPRSVRGPRDKQGHDGRAGVGRDSEQLGAGSGVSERLDDGGEEPRDGRQREVQPGIDHTVEVGCRVEEYRSESGTVKVVRVGDTFILQTADDQLALLLIHRCTKMSARVQRPPC
jgi:hypothetical protein